MYSLGYISRKFDALAPRSIQSRKSSLSSHNQPSGSRRETALPSEPPLKRVKTWSAKSFLFSPEPAQILSSPKRSFSSPSFPSLISHAHHTPAPTPTPAPATQLERIVEHVFIIRVLAILWDSVCSAWSSVASSRSPRTQESGSEKDMASDHVSIQLHAPSESIPPSPSLIYLSREDTEAVIGLEPPTTTNSDISRSSTPSLMARKTPIHFPKTLVLDLDETLIHSTSRPMFSSGYGGSGLLGLGSFGRRNKGAGHMVEVVLGGRSTLYHVYKRPFVDFFLRTVAGWYTLVIFTASMQEYADPVIDWLDAGRGILERRLFRDSCTQLPNGSYTKDLSVVEPDLARVCLIDNSPISYRVNEANGIPIEGWTHDPSDEALLNLLPVLDSLRFTSDVRRVLGIRGKRP